MSKPYPTTDPRTNRPLPPDFVIEQRHADYTAQHHDTWRTLFARQTALLKGRVVDEFFVGLDALGIDGRGIPDFREMNRVLSAATGWTVVAVPGLVPDGVFFEHLAERRFPAGYWIRSPEQLDYIEEPDVFHDVYGHVPLLMQPRYADYMAAYGRAGRGYVGGPALANLAQLYWYTVEFGLMQTDAGLRIFGAGIISSAGEVVYALDSPKPARVRFDCDRVMRTLAKIDEFQRIYFVLRGYDELPALKPADLDLRIAAARALRELQPDEVIESDIVLTAPDDEKAGGAQGGDFAPAMQ